MEPRGFELANGTLFGGPPEKYGVEVEDLPVCRFEQQGTPRIVSRWRPTLRERLSLLFGGSVWLETIGRTHPPIAVSGCREYLREVDE